MKIIKKYFRGFSIQKKLTLSTWIVAVIPIVITFLIILFVFFDTSIKDSRRQAQLLLDRTTQELDNVFGQAQTSMFSLSTDINVQNAIDSYSQESYKERLNFRDYIRNRMANISTMDQKICNISIYIKSSKLTFSQNLQDINLLTYYENTPWFAELLEKKQKQTLTSGSSILDGRPVYILCSNIVSMKNGEVLGLVYLEIDRGMLESLFKDLVANNNDAILIGDYRIAAGEEQNKTHTSVYSRSEVLDTEIEYRLQMETLRQGYGTAVFFIIVGITILLLLIYMIDKILADWFAARIILLRNATRQIATGNLDVEVTDDYEDEIGELAVSFNNMAKDMKQLIEREYIAKIENQQATLQALQSQINPHFVYNTLESISMLALISNQYQIVDITQAFSAMMRYSIQTRLMVTVGEELENVRNFITIQKIRFPDKFHIVYRIEEGYMNQRLPRLCLQPLVENAFKHGFEDLPNQRNLEISIFVRGSELILRIFNDGMAIPRERILQIRKWIKEENPSDSLDCFALRNLNRRLYLVFGIKSRLSIISKNRLGTLVTIHLPVQQEADYEKNINM